MLQLIVSAGFVLIYNLLFFKTNFWGLGFAILIALINLSFFIVRNRESRLIWLGISASVVSLIFGLMVAWRADGLIQFVNISVSIVLACTSLYFYKLDGVFNFKIIEYLTAPLSVVAQLPVALFGKIDQPGKEELPSSSASQISKSLVNGLLISIPVVGVLGYLLIQADPIFGKLTQDFLSSIIERLIVSIVLFTALFTFVRVQIKKTGIFSKQIDETKDQKGYEMMVVLAAVAILFGIFIAVQFQYLFSNPDLSKLQEVGIASLTYSEYVRKGFFELLIVGSIVIGIVSFIVKKLKQIDGREKILIQTFGSVVLLETGMILWSDFLRLQSYAMENGLTRARIAGFIFLLYLAYLLLVMLFEMIQKVNQKQLFLAIVPVTLLFIASLTIVNIDSLIATRYQPKVNNEIDYFYITSLSADSYPSWKAAIVEANQLVGPMVVKETLDGEDYRKLFYISRSLSYIQNQRDDIKFQTWQSFNLGKNAANSYIKDNPETFNELDVLVTLVSQLENRVGQQVKDTTTLDRDITPPLVQQ